MRVFFNGLVNIIIILNKKSIASIMDFEYSCPHRCLRRVLSCCYIFSQCCKGDMALWRSTLSCMMTIRWSLSSLENYIITPLDWHYDNFPCGCDVSLTKARPRVYLESECLVKFFPSDPSLSRALKPVFFAMAICQTAPRNVNLTAEVGHPLKLCYFWWQSNIPVSSHGGLSLKTCKSLRYFGTGGHQGTGGY